MISTSPEYLPDLPEKVAMNGDWQSIETAPKSGKDILVYCSDTREQFVAFFNSKGEWQFATFRKPGDRVICQPTQWMPLPSPPEGEEPHD